MTPQIGQIVGDHTDIVSHETMAATETFHTAILTKHGYQLQQMLAHHPGRQTWLAEDLKTQELVVLKLLVFSDQLNWDDLKLFEREAQVLKQLNHQRIPQYRDYFAIDDQLLWFGLVQDYIPGKSLKHLLKEGKTFTEAEVRTLAINILEILAYLHGLNPPVLHRDIKPSNLVWSEEQQIYLVDFGAVQDRAAAEGATFTIVGTYGYAPMEQFGGRTVPASDLFSLGMTLIHLLTGIAPADLPQENLWVYLIEHFEFSHSLVHWLQQMTAPDWKKRFRTAQQALESLEGKSSSEAKGTLCQPINSQIKLKKSINQLEIIIPVFTLHKTSKNIFLRAHKALQFSCLYEFSKHPEYITSLLVNRRSVFDYLKFKKSFKFILNNLISTLLLVSLYPATTIFILPFISPLCRPHFLVFTILAGTIGASLFFNSIKYLQIRVILAKNKFSIYWIYKSSFTFNQWNYDSYFPFAVIGGDRISDIQEITTGRKIMAETLEMVNQLEAKNELPEIFKQLPVSANKKNRLWSKFFVNARRSLKQMVVIQVSDRAYFLGAAAPLLSEAECQWLVQEIRTWLGLH